MTCLKHCTSIPWDRSSHSDKVLFYVSIESILLIKIFCFIICDKCDEISRCCRLSIIGISIYDLGCRIDDIARNVVSDNFKDLNAILMTDSIGKICGSDFA